MGSVGTEARNFYASVLKNNGIQEQIQDITVRIPEELHGEHFASTVEYVTIKLEGGRILEFFVKKPNSNAEHIEMLEDMNAFGKEAGAFNTVFKDMQQFYASRTKSATKTLDFLAKCYYADENRIVLENLAKSNYFLISKVDKLDLETARYVLRNLAKFHGVSYAMRVHLGEKQFLDKYPCLIEYTYLPGKNDSIMSRMFSKPILQNIHDLLDAVGDLPNKKFAQEILYKYDYKKVYDEMEAVINREDGTHFIPLINHGDVWSNNMLYHRDLETNALDNQVFIDFQQIKYGSPTLDLSYFLYTSVKPEVRRSNFQNLVQLYFEELKKHVLDLDIPFDHKYEDFLNDYKRRSIHGCLIGMFMLVMHQAMAGYDVDSEVGEFAENMNNRIVMFTKKYPEKAVLIATEICAMVKEQYA